MKFLADEQFPHLAVVMLVRLDWDVREVTKVPRLRGVDDVFGVLAHAKRAQRILLTVDTFENQVTRNALHDDVRRTKKGKVITVSGGPEQGWQSIVGKLLFHAEQWGRFFEAGHGIVAIGNLNPNTLRLKRPVELNRLRHRDVRQGEEYLRRPKQLPLTKVKPAGPPRAGLPLPESRTVSPPATNAGSPILI